MEAVMIEAASTTETSVNVYQTTRCYNSEDSHLHTRRRENLKYYKTKIGYYFSKITPGGVSWPEGRKSWTTLAYFIRQY
jgi:hypothetical protein